MSASYTRRDFLAASALGTAAMAQSFQPARQSVTNHAESKAPGDITAWVTDDSQFLGRLAPIRWQAAKSQAAADAVVLNPEKQFQAILGFGGAFTDAACYTLQQLPPAAREDLLHMLFHPSEMGFGACRICIGSSDYSTAVYSYNDGEADPELKRFSIDHDRAYILPILREARKLNPNLFLVASPWSPPGWMKANGSMLGGSMRREHMPSYANYFLKFLQSYEQEGVPIQAITVQNEVDTDQDGRMPACIWPQEYEADFVRLHLGPLLKRSGVNTKIWLIDHNYNLWGRAMAELETPDVLKYANAIAWHGYIGKPEWMERVRTMYPEVDMFWTEGGPDYTAPDYGSDWAKWSANFADILRNGCRSVIAWNLALDQEGKPNIGPFYCGGLVTIHSQSKEITYSGQYRAFAQYSRFIAPGSRRIDSQSSAQELHHVALETSDGHRVLVLTNPGAARNCDLQLGSHRAQLSLSQNSVTTLLWD